MERTGACRKCGTKTGSEAGQHFTEIGILCDFCHAKLVLYKILSRKGEMVQK